MDRGPLRIVRDEPTPGPGRSVAAREALIQHDPEACVSCFGCVRGCPTRAVRVVDGLPEIGVEKCVGCGTCVAECGVGAMKVRDDTGRVKALLAGERPVVAVLATEFAAALHPMSISEIERGLESLGFFAVESTLLGEEIVAEGYEKAHARDSAAFIIRSTCGVVVEWVRRFHPQFTSALAPLVPPYVAQARLARSMYEEDIAVVYVSPCYVRKNEAFDPQFAGAVDACIDFAELKRMFAECREAGGHRRPSERQVARPVPCKEISLTDGFPRLSLASRSLIDPGVAVVRGLREADRLLRAITEGESGPQIIDILNCEGCIDGPAVNPGISVFAKRNLDATEREASGCTSVSTRSMLRHLPAVEVKRSFRPEPLLAPLPESDAVDEQLSVAGMTREDAPDCGACGYDRCVEHAVAVHLGDSTWEMCFPLQRRLLAANVALLAETTPLDAVTGWWSRRIFAQRLAEEAARAARYGAPTSLLIVAIDVLEDVADEHGDQAVDDVLSVVARAIREDMRQVDVCGRYHERELGLILPATDKTSAFAVGEKLRERVAGLTVPVPGPGYRERSGPSVRDLTLSVGVATAGRAIADAAGLQEAARRALDEARQAGGDQVRLALG